MDWTMKHGAAVVAVAATLGTLTHELAGLTGATGVLDGVEAGGAAIAVLASVVHAYVQAAAVKS